MVDTIKELSELSHKLKQKSDTLNEVITSTNEKLAKLNLGIEDWLIDPIEADDAYFLDDEERKFPRRDAILLGYCKFDDGWALATKRVTLVTKSNRYSGEEHEEVLTATNITSLLASPRSIRTKAMRLIPRLLDAIKTDAEHLLDFIENAEKTAEKL